MPDANAAYWYAGVPAVPVKLKNKPASIDPPAIKGAEKRPLPVVGFTEEATSRKAAPVQSLPPATSGKKPESK